MIWDVRSWSRIRIFCPSGSRIPGSKSTGSRIQNQGCGSAFISSGSGSWSRSSILDWIPIRIRIQFGSRNKIEKITAGKKLFWIKNYNLPIPRPPKRKSKLQKKPSALKGGHPTLQNMKIYIFMGHFCPPGSGSTDPIESGSNPDPDPQPCPKHW